MKIKINSELTETETSEPTIVFDVDDELFDLIMKMQRVCFNEPKKRAIYIYINKYITVEAIEEIRIPEDESIILDDRK